MLRGPLLVDGLRSGLLEWDELMAVPLWRDAAEAARASGESEPRALRTRAIALAIDRLATDLLASSHTRLERADLKSADEVVELAEPVIAYSDATAVEAAELARFLRQRLYRHYRVVRMAAKAERILRDLWKVYANDPRQLPPAVVERVGDEPLERSIADYLAGMTDRFAMDEHRKLFDPHAHV